MAEYPNYFSCSRDDTITTGGSRQISFGFKASWVRVLNRGAASLYVNLKSTAATTGDIEVLSSGEFVQSMPVIGGLAYLSTVMQSTTTGVAAIAGFSAAGNL